MEPVFSADYNLFRNYPENYSVLLQFTFYIYIRELPIHDTRNLGRGMSMAALFMQQNRTKCLPTRERMSWSVIDYYTAVNMNTAICNNTGIN